METLSIYRNSINIQKPYQYIETLSTYRHHIKIQKTFNGEACTFTRWVSDPSVTTTKMLGNQLHGNQTQGNQILGNQTQLG